MHDPKPSVGLQSGLTAHQKITDSKESLGLASKGKDQKPQGVGPSQSVGGGMKVDGKA